MKHIIKTFKDLSVSGVLLVHLEDKKVRLISSSNFISSLQRILPELGGSERVEILARGIPDKKLRSLTCFVHKQRFELLGYKVECSIKKWWLESKVEDMGGVYKWVVRARNTYSSIMLGIFDKEEMGEFLKAYYPGGVISGAIISSNNETKKYYEVHKTG